MLCLLVNSEFYGLRLTVCDKVNGDCRTALILYGSDIAYYWVAAQLLGTDDATERNVWRNTAAVYSAELCYCLRNTHIVGIERNYHIHFVKPGGGNNRLAVGQPLAVEKILIARVAVDYIRCRQKRGKLNTAFFVFLYKSYRNAAFSRRFAR